MNKFKAILVKMKRRKNLLLISVDAVVRELDPYNNNSHRSATSDRLVLTAPKLVEATVGALEVEDLRLLRARKAMRILRCNRYMVNQQS